MYEHEPASVHASSAHFDPSSSSTTHQVMREHSSSNHAGRRLASTPASYATPQSTEHSTNSTVSADGDDESKSQADIERLTQRLDSARRDQQEIDKQFQEEDQESQKILRELAQERDRLRSLLKEREENSSELRKHGNYLDKLNRATQSKKAAQEKVLTQKRAERARMREEINSWDSETSEINRDIDHLLRQRDGIIAGSGVELMDVRKRITIDQSVMKSMEEEIRLKGAQIKAIENEMEIVDHIDSDGRLRARVEKEVEQTWEMNTLAAQTQLANLWQILQQVRPGNWKRMPQRRLTKR